MHCFLQQNGNFQTSNEWPYKWEKTELTYSIKNSTQDFDKLRLALNLAMTTWDIEIPIKLKFVPDGGDITLEFSDDDPYFTQSPGVLAYAYFPGTARYSGRIVFNDLYLWSIDGKPISAAEYTKRTGKQVQYQDATYKTWNIMHTLIHEIGHSLGLTHSESNTDVMFPYYNGVLDLSKNDISRIQAKYGKSTPAQRLKNWLIRKKKFLNL